MCKFLETFAVCVCVIIKDPKENNSETIGHNVREIVSVVTSRILYS